VIDLVTAGRLSVLYDDRIVSEHDEVLHRPRFDFEPRALHAILMQIRAGGEQVSAEPLAVVLPDADDLPFLEVAVAGAAGALITGNAPHYKPTKGTHHVPIRSPRDFIADWSRR
jgi:predicted nucleic acid-binding protein